MGDNLASDVSSNVNSVHVRPSSALPAALIAEDDDEPPSSGPSHRSSQVTPPPGVGLKQTPTDGATLTPTTAPPSGKLAVLSEKLPFATSSRPVDVDGVQATIVPATRGAAIKARLRMLFTPTKPLGPEPTYRASAIATIRYTPLNFCLLFIPVSWALHYSHQSPTMIFVFSCLGIIPLAALLGFGTEQVAHRTSSTVGGLLNATLGNVIEMIIAGIALSEVCSHSCVRVVESLLTGFASV